MKTTIEILYDKCLFDNYANADKILEDFLYTTRQSGDLSEEVNDNVQRFYQKKHNLRNKATSNIKIQQIFSSLSLDDVGIYLRDGLFLGDIGVINLHPSKRTHWVCYINENYFDSYGCVCPKKLSKFTIKQNGYCLYSEYQIQKNDSFWASFCLYTIYLTKVFGIDFKSAASNLYYQSFS